MDQYQAVIEVDGEPRGYAIYRIENGWGPTGPASTMNVLEVTGVDPVAEQALWQWLLSMDLVRTVAGRRGPVPHPLQSWLLEPRRLALTIVDGLWLRILDLPAALTARRYVGSGSLVLDVADDMFDSNAGRWQLSVSDGRAEVSRTKDAPDLELDIARWRRRTSAGSGSSISALPAGFANASPAFSRPRTRCSPRPVPRGIRRRSEGCD